MLADEDLCSELMKNIVDIIPVDKDVLGRLKIEGRFLEELVCDLMNSYSGHQACLAWAYLEWTRIYIIEDEGSPGLSGFSYQVVKILPFSSLEIGLL